MENSSKALLIAAAVLIVILLIAVSIKIFNSPKEVQEQATGVGTSISEKTKDAVEDLSSSFDINREIISEEITLTPNDEIQDSSTIATEWHIDTVEELKEFADLVNNGNDFEGITVYLDADLDLNNEEWTPIGSTIYYDEVKQKNRINSFAGTFDGKNNTISKLKVNGEDYAGLFGYSKGTIKNLTIEDSEIKAINYVGGIAGVCKNIENCTIVNSSIKGEWFIGGIVGYTIKGAQIKQIYSTDSCSIRGTSRVRRTYRLCKKSS